MTTAPLETFQPQYDRWRHGGWYVVNVRYPSGACGCVSRNYADRKWRIVCDKRPGSFPGGPNDHTYPNRDAAARAEHELAMAARYTCARLDCTVAAVVVYQGAGHGGIYGSCAEHKPWEHPADGRPKPLDQFSIIHGEA